MIKWNGHIKPDHHIEHVFTCGGTPYFKFTDTFSIPCERAMDALHIYQEFAIRTDDEFFRLHIAAKKKIYNTNPIKLFDLKKLDDQLEERLSMIIPPARMIESLSSVLYFDQEENPYKYERAYAERKKVKWRNEKMTDVEGKEFPNDFFLCQRLRDLVPSLELQDQEIQSYLTIAQMMDNEQLKTIYSYLSSQQQNHNLFKSHWYTNGLEKMNA